MSSPRAAWWARPPTPWPSRAVSAPRTACGARSRRRCAGSASKPSICTRCTGRPATARPSKCIGKRCSTCARPARCATSACPTTIWRRCRRPSSWATSKRCNRRSRPSAAKAPRTCCPGAQATTPASSSTAPCSRACCRAPSAPSAPRPCRKATGAPATPSSWRRGWRPISSLPMRSSRSRSTTAPAWARLPSPGRWPGPLARTGVGGGPLLPPPDEAALALTARP
ncbi:aldo/keto reductase [Bordetella pertussis]|nr:aldo/keto reductase [Bordetella pertussis]